MSISSSTISVCPVCLSRIPAERIVQGEDVYLVKECPDHGRFQTIIWRGRPLFDGWRRPKIPIAPPVAYRPVDRGCPFDCGLCPDHRQRTCTILLEVTKRCNLNCPVCFADAGGGHDNDPDMETIEKWFVSARVAGGECNIQLSGGEPTMRDDLAAIISLGRDTGFTFIQINTNGLRLGHDDAYVRDLKAAGLDSIFLQFDGTDDHIYQKIRGRALLGDKKAAIEACRRHGIGVVLVPTLIPGINTDDIGAMVDLAAEWSPVVRGIHFQPISYFGRFQNIPGDRDRFTLPELMRAIEDQTDHRFKAEDFAPPGCENALCSFHANYLVEQDGRIVHLGSGSSCCCSEPERADIGAMRAINRVARQWSAPQGTIGPMMPTETQRSCCGQAQAEIPLPMARSASQPMSQPISMDAFLARARSHTLSVSAMAFQDAWNLDLDRLRDCCIHVMAPNGYLVPFCAFNLTGVDGRPLYRTT